MVLTALRPPGSSLSLSHETVLALLLALEIAVFCAAGTNFMSWANAFEIVRLSVEVGLLALAMTPVIVTGGIDLSVGSLMDLAAVIFGMLWRDAGLPIPLAAVGTLIATSMPAGRLGEIEIAGDNILLGQPLTFTKENIDQFDF